MPKTQIKRFKTNELTELTKPNMITLQGKFDLSAIQQDLINVMFLNFNNIEEKDKTLTLKLQCADIRKCLRWDKDKESYNNDFIKKEFDKIRDQHINISYRDETGQVVHDTFFYFYRASHKTKDGIITLYFDGDWYKLMKYGLDNYYTQYNFLTCMSLKGKYAKRFYDLFFAWLQKQGNTQYQSFLITPKQIQEKLKTPKYKYPRDYIREVIKKAIDEINTKTSLQIGYAYNRKLKKFIFGMCDKNTYIENIPEEELEKMRDAIAIDWTE